MSALRSILYFAAGFGTRMRPLTDDRPKPLIDVAGMPLLTHALKQSHGLAPERQVVNAHYRAEQIVDYATAHNLTVSVERPDILDTGGGLKHAAPLLTGDVVWTCNTDAVWNGPSPLRVLQSAWQPMTMAALLLCIPAARATGHRNGGDFDIGPDGRLIRGTSLVYCGVQIITLAPVLAHPERVFSLNAIWTQLDQERRLYGVIYPGGWCDVGHPEGIPMAEALLAETT